MHNRKGFPTLLPETGASRNLPPLQNNDRSETVIVILVTARLRLQLIAVRDIPHQIYT
jgi:hypothetical protein